MKPRSEWGPADELAQVVMIGFTIVAGILIFAVVAWAAFAIYGWLVT